MAEDAHTDVSTLVAMMAITTLEHEFDGLGDQAQTEMVRRWLVAESHVEAIDQTVDNVLAEDDQDE